MLKCLREELDELEGFRREDLTNLLKQKYEEDMRDYGETAEQHKLDATEDEFEDLEKSAIAENEVEEVTGKMDDLAIAADANQVPAVFVVPPTDSFTVAPKPA